MTIARSLALIFVLAGGASAQDDRSVEASSTRDPKTLTRLDITAEAQRKFDGFKPGVKFYDGFPQRTPLQGEPPHVLIAETPEDGMRVLRDFRDVLRYVESTDTPERALALCRFLSDPPAGPPLTFFVELAPRIVTREAVYLLSAAQVKELSADGPRAAAHDIGGFRVERTVVSLQRLATARELSRDGEGLELAPDQSEALETPGTSVHLLDVIATAEEHVIGANYAVATPERVVRLLVVKVPARPQ